MRLIVEDLSCVRGGRRVFEGAGFEIEAGAFAALRGPNGSGKSTLLRAMCGLVGVEDGDVRLGDASLRSGRDALQEQILYAGHLDAVKPQMTVSENLDFWRRFYSGRETTAEVLKTFSLDHIADAPAAYCSAGQKRRLGLARLAVVDRPVWLLDEPTVSLDIANVAVFADLIARHCAAGGIALVATHVDLGRAPDLEIRMEPFQSSAKTAGEVDPFLAEGAFS
ncbi:MAG: heme ABC exporter ATP-binding protein CcmA [Pseudomonadota bacterium]